jgi:tungstate transport system ATP-binding protein
MARVRGRAGPAAARFTRVIKVTLCRNTVQAFSLRQLKSNPSTVLRAAEADAMALVTNHQQPAALVVALDRLGLPDTAAVRSGLALSGGQQQRLALARAWALQAQVLLLDEPTASLDPAGKREVEQLMAEFAAGGMTLIFATHNLGQVKRLADRVLYLEQGRLLDDAPMDRFFEPLRPGPAAVFLRGDLM